MLYGVDVSNWQGNIQFAPLPADFVIIKATGGTGFVNPLWKTQLANARAAGTRVGLYHFFRDGYTGTTWQAEADHFINTVKAEVAGTDAVLVLDWEDPATLANTAWAKGWLDRVTAALSRKPLIYMNLAATQAGNWSTVAGAGYKLWLAWYFNNLPVIGHKPPSDQPTAVPYWGVATIWQYSQYGRLPSYAGDLDLNVAYEDLWSRVTSMQPTPGYITQPYGKFPQASGEPWPHTGDDFAGQIGAPCYTISAGKVLYSGPGHLLPYNLADMLMFVRGSNASGNQLLIAHGDIYKGGWIEAFNHCDRLLVATGATVSRGQKVATVGNTGNTQGAHLHYECIYVPWVTNQPPFGRYNPQGQVRAEDAAAAAVTPPKEWDELATEAQIRTLVAAELAKERAKIVEAVWNKTIIRDGDIRVLQEIANIRTEQLTNPSNQKVMDVVVENQKRISAISVPQALVDAVLHIKATVDAFATLLLRHTEQKVTPTPVEPPAPVVEGEK